MENLTLLTDLDYEDFCKVVEKSKYLQKRIKDIAADRIDFCVGNLRVRYFDSVEEYLAQVGEICKLFSEDLVSCAFENEWLLDNDNYEEIIVDTENMTAYKLVEMQ